MGRGLRKAELRVEPRRFAASGLALNGISNRNLPVLQIQRGGPPQAATLQFRRRTESPPYRWTDSDPSALDEHTAAELGEHALRDRAGLAGADDAAVEL